MKSAVGKTSKAIVVSSWRPLRQEEERIRPRRAFGKTYTSSRTGGMLHLAQRKQTSMLRSQDTVATNVSSGEEPDWSGELTVSPSPPQDQRVVVIGAGPAGSVAALVLAKRGYHVDVYEKRPEPKLDQVDSRRSYVIALSQRGVSALKAVGIEIQQREDAAYLGTCTQRFKGKRRVSPADPGSVCFDRIELAQLLIDEVKLLVPGKVKFHFQHSCEGLNLEAKTITLGNKEGESTSVNYDLLIAADGVNSAVRKYLELGLPRFQARVEDSGREYKTFRGLKADLEPPEFAGKRGRSIHLFLGNNSLTSLSCRRNTDGTYSGTFALKSGDFEKLETRQDYEQLIRKSVRGVPRDWPAEVAKQCVYGPTSSNGKRVRCSQIHGPGVILLGDAAHAVTPIGGQGCNAALEDGAVLAKLLDQTGGDLQQMPIRWTAVRHADVKALVNIESSFYKLVGGRRLGFLDPAFLRLVAHITLGFLLHKLMPWWFKPAALTQLGSPMPYSEIERKVNRDATAVLLLVLATVLLVALKLMRMM